ncbi:MAG: hypothetical protein K2I53_09430 [Lachnospiraceae bacterium]|nr:hypothetical protein [Lachnospiraceae bacterium]
MKNEDLGFIKIHRKILEWGWYTDVNTKVLFIHMLLKANWKEGNFKGTKVPRGSFVSSLDKLSEETLLTKREIRTAISHLKTTGEVTVKATNKFSVFTVENYNLYQSFDMQSDKQETKKRLYNDSLTTQIEEKIRKEEELNNITKDDIICSEPENSAPNPSGILLPLVDKSFYDVPADKITLWQETYPAVDIEQELRRMIAWLDSNPTKRKTRRGIERFINNWLARTQDSGGSKGQKEVREAVGNNAYNTDAGWERISRAIDEAGEKFDRRDDLPFG